MSRDSFDLIPQQYHAGLDKLWAALSLTDGLGEDVFTLSARAIEWGKTTERIMRCQHLHGNLARVFIYLCHCGRLTIDECYQKGESYHTEESVVEVANLDEARAIYRQVFGCLRESLCTREEVDEWDNFIVTGSLCFCKKHRT